MRERKESNFVSNVIYMRNCGRDIMPFISSLYELMEKNFSQYEFIFVDDASCDDGSERVRQFFREKGRKNTVTLLRMGGFQGIEAAMAAGIDLAIGDYVFEYDTVFIDYETSLIMDIYDRCVAGKDVVTAVPKRSRSLLSGIFYAVYNRTSGGSGEYIYSETFCIVSRRAINRVNAMVRNIPYRKALYASCGLPVETVKYAGTKTSGERKEKIEMENRVDLAVNTFALFTNVIEKSTLFLSMCFLLFSIAVGVYVCVIYFGADKPVEGWAPLMGFLSAAFFGMFLIFTIVIKYLALILNMIFVKERYKIESVEKL